MCYNAAMTDFLSTFVGSPARAKVLRLFLFNEGVSFTVADVAKRAQISKESAQKEVNFLKRLGVITGERAKGKRTLHYALDSSSKHLRMLQMFVRDTSATDHDAITTRLRPAGRLKLVVASGMFVDDSSSRVDLLIVADSLNERKLASALRSIEADLGRELRYASFVTDEFQYRLTIYDKLIRDIFDYPHLIFLDKIGATK